MTEGKVQNKLITKPRNLKSTKGESFKKILNREPSFDILCSLFDIRDSLFIHLNPRPLESLNP